MSPKMFSRRHVVALLLAGGGTTVALQPAFATGGNRRPTGPASRQSEAASGIVPNARRDQSAALQAAIDDATARGEPLVLPAGRILAREIELRPGTTITGSGSRTILALSGDGPLLRGSGVHGLRLERLALEGLAETSARGTERGLVEISGSRDMLIRDVTVTASRSNLIALTGCSGRIADCTLAGAEHAALFSLDATGLEVEGNHVRDCANNGILIWRTKPGEDGTRVSGNRIERIGATAGGTGQNGNGVNVFRAASVLLANNRITDCAYSAIRANSASNVQMVANSIERIGEVALYAEFGFQGALIAQNVVDGAAAGISVTNFNEGGRLAVIQGNLIRNLHRREFEPVDKRGEGIAVEADASVTGNTVEGAPTAGIVVGWGPHMRDVAVTGNVIRNSATGVMITDDLRAGAALIAQNLISGATGGAVRLMRNGKLVGEDLSKVAPRDGRITVTGNVAVDRPS